MGNTNVVFRIYPIACELLCERRVCARIADKNENLGRKMNYDFSLRAGKKKHYFAKHFRELCAQTHQRTTRNTCAAAHADTQLFNSRQQIYGYPTCHKQ